MSPEARKRIAVRLLQLAREGDRMLVDGDFVIAHSHVRHRPTDAGIAVVHRFRFEGDRIGELWDVGQAIPADNPNRDGIF